MAYTLGQCMGCPFDGRKQVPFVGPEDSPFAIVGEYPGTREIKEKVPFVGRVGKLLDDLLTAIGIDRRTVRMGDAILCGPVTEEDRSQKWFPEVVERCAMRCAADGDLGSARSIAALGTTAALGLLGRPVTLGGSYPSRGALHWTQDKRAVFPAWNPAAILRAGGSEDRSSKLSDADVEVLLIDIQRAWMFADGRLKEWLPRVRLLSDPKEFAAWCRTFPDRVAIDVETDSADPMTAKLLVVGMARRLEGSVVSPPASPDVVSSLRPADDIETVSFWWPNANEDAKSALRDLLANGLVTKTFHNLSYDVIVLQRHIGPVVGGVSDTLLLSHARFPEVPVGLAPVAQTWLVVPPWKRDHYAREDDRKRRQDLVRGKGYAVPEWTEERILDLMEYNGYDVGATLAVEPMLVAECEREETLLAAAVDVAQAREASRMTEYGLLIDLKVKAELEQKARARHAEAIDQMKGLVDAGLKDPANAKAAEELSKRIRDEGGFNYNSQVMLPLAFDVCGVRVPSEKGSVTATGKRSFNKDALGSISDHPLVSSLFACRSTARQLSVFFGEGSLPTGPDGRLHMPWKIHGTPTGRWSSGADDEHDDVVSTNLQNWPNFLRSMVVAAPGSSLVGCDFCVVRGTRVATDRGQVRIECVRPGLDRVLLEDGSKADVTALIDRGEQEAYTVETEMGYILRCTANHRIRAVSEDGSYVWQSVGELSNGTYVAVQPSRHVSSVIPRHVVLDSYPLEPPSPRAKPIRLPDMLTPEVAELFGYLVGDGNDRHSDVRDKRVQWVVCDKDPDLYDSLSRTFRAVFDRTPRTRRYRGVIEGSVHSVRLADWLLRLGVCKADVPPVLWESSTDCVGAFLRGLFEADGCVGAGNAASGGNRISFCAKREVLARSVHKLLLGLGVVSRCHRVVRTLASTGKQYDAWLVEVFRHWAGRFEEVVGFMSGRKRSILADYVRSDGNFGRRFHERKTGFPNLERKARDLKPTGKLAVLLNNAISRKDLIGTRKAKEVQSVSKAAYDALDLKRVAEYGTVFDRVVSITPCGSQQVYDLSVPGPTTYISDGFVSHNCQLEYRVIALLAGEQSLLNLFNDPARPDLHNTNAARLFGYRWDACDPTRVSTPEEIERRKKQRKVYRTLTKSGLYGAMYLGTAKTIRKRLQAGALRESDKDLAEVLRRMTDEQCQEFVDAIPRLWPAIEAWRQQKILDLQEAQRVRMPITGRHRVWPLGMFEPTQAVNTNVQGPAGDIMSTSFLKLTTALPPEARIILQVHDSVVVECPEPMANSVLKIMSDTMTTNLTIGEHSCMFTVDAKIGPSWDVV